MEAGEITIGEVYNCIRKKEHQETLAAHELPEGKYRVLYVDPPWSLGSDPVASTKPDALGYYHRMTTEEIAEVPIQDICEKNAALFMWAPPDLLEEAFEVMRSWGEHCQRRVSRSFCALEKYHCRSAPSLRHLPESGATV